LYDAQMGDNGPKDDQGRPKAEYIRNYIRLGPLDARSSVLHMVDARSS